jgi:predicted transposase/invertase (TIGR01784 family)
MTAQMETLVCKPSLDVVFKAIFVQNPDLLEDFLSLVLETKINHMQILNGEISPTGYDEKFARLDILIKTDNGEKINVELQNSNEGNFRDRSVYYCSKLFSGDLKSGKNYSELAKTICINILQFPLFKGDNYRSTVFPIVKETGEIVTENFEIIYFETPKLPEEYRNHCEQWLKFFTVKTEEALTYMENTDYNPIAKAASVVRHMNADDRMRELARIREDRYVNEQLALGEAIQKGIAQGISIGKQEGITIGEARGITIGKQEGITIGKQEGITIGELNTKHSIAHTMYNLGFPMEVIAQATGLTIEEI